MKTYCIIGASAAGISAATQIRALDTSARIIIFSAHEELPYNVCLLTHFLRREKSKKDLQLKPLSWFFENAIELKVGTRIKQIKASEKCVVDQNGICYYYEKLLIGVGTRPKLPSWFNTTMDGVFPFYSLADAEAIQKRLITHLVKTILVIGGGINGLECADALNTCGYSVTVLEAQSHFLYQWLTPEESEKLRGYADACGVSLVSGEYVISIENRENKAVITTRSGVIYGADMVIVATGSIPATDFLHNSGIECKDCFIITNDYMQTSIPDIFAAGDCALVKNPHSFDFKASTRWSDAVAQGMCAGKAMLGELIPCAAIVPGAQTTVFKQFLAFFGQTYGMNQKVCVEGHYERISSSPEGKLRGFVVFGNRVRALELRKKLTI